MAAAASPDGIERAPEYPTWEAERVALVKRETELQCLIDGHDEPPSVAEDIYNRLLAEGWDEEHCQAQADSVESDHASQLKALRDQLREVRARLSIIKPQVHMERTAALRTTDKGEYQAQLFGYLDRIALALESLAGCRERQRSKPRKVGA